MKVLITLARLRADERGLALRALLLVATIRMALWVLPFKQLRRLTGDWKNVPLAVSHDMPVSRLVWAVRAASRRIPAATCLTQSLALHCLLTRAGHRSQLRIGANKNQAGRFQAHAWVEYEGEPLLSSAGEVASFAHVLAMEDKLA
jgi:hypothetical protein